MQELEIIGKLMPESIKEAVYEGREHTLASLATGIEDGDYTLDKIAAYLGARCAARRAKWASVVNGIIALDRVGK